jgi:hypothetical protein
MVSFPFKLHALEIFIRLLVWLACAAMTASLNKGKLYTFEKSAKLFKEAQVKTIWKLCAMWAGSDVFDATVDADARRCELAGASIHICGR